MTHSEFTAALKREGLTVGRFAEMIGRPPQSVSNWKSSKVPDWVGSWLALHEKARRYDEARAALCGNDTN
jgi:hypothetical protein